MNIKNRKELAEYFHQLGFKKGVEMGVFDGRYSEVLLQNNPNLELWSVDCWQVYDGYKDHRFQRSVDRAYARAVERLKPYNCHIVKKFGMDALADFEDESLDFVYLDGNHQYKAISQDLPAWAKKVRIGGIVSGHDYYVTKSNKAGVIHAVDEYVAKHGYELHTTPWDEEAEHVDDKQPSWYFVKTHPCE